MNTEDFDRTMLLVNSNLSSLSCEDIEIMLQTILRVLTCGLSEHYLQRFFSNVSNVESGVLLTKEE